MRRACSMQLNTCILDENFTIAKLEDGNLKNTKTDAMFGISMKSQKTWECGPRPSSILLLQ